MKKSLILPFFLFVLVSLVAESKIIGLKNSINLKSNTPIEENIDSSISNFQSKTLIPSSIYIGELGNFYSFDKNRNKLLEFVSEFLEALKNKQGSSYIADDFLFIYTTVYHDLLIGHERALVRWNLGYPEIVNGEAEIKLELYYRNKLLIGYIYLEREESWSITDLQLEEQEREIFDPSSPF